MYWANFIHFYQPPTQKAYWIHRITKESYRPVIEGIAKHKKAKVTLNINAILTELLIEHGYPGLVKKLGELAKEGKVEFTQSAKYHPLLPRIPKSEMVRQISLNDHTNKKHFGAGWKPRGFFPPEMGFSTDVAKTIAELGYEWAIIDELSFPGGAKQIDWSTIYTAEGLGDFSLFFRDRGFSFKVLSAQLGTGDMVIRELGKERLSSNTYLTTAMDGETFGHHRPGLEQLLFDLWQSSDLPSVTISELKGLFTQREVVTPLPSTWALMAKDIERNIPFARWDDPHNEIHKKQWALTDLLIETIQHADSQKPGFRKARNLADQAVHSDQYWWASAKPWWSIEMIEAGAKDHVDAIAAVPGISSATTQTAERLYREILSLAFDWQRSGTVEALAKEEDEEIRQRTDSGNIHMSEKDFEEMVGTLKKQMLAAVKEEEFERAAQFRDRIKELREDRAYAQGKKGSKQHKHTVEDDWGF